MSVSQEEILAKGERYWLLRSLDQLRRDLADARQLVKGHAEDAQRIAAAINALKIKARKKGYPID